MTRVALFLLVFVSLTRFAWAQKSKPALDDASLDTLMNLEVTSVSKKEEKLSQSAAAIFVITQEDIRRSGATSIPEVLRIVPGLDVAQVDANNWAISSRGFNDRFANKMLVMIDGRTVYSMLFCGTFWDVQDTVLEDIERIEVIRGPGGALWGANAVNGIINIITKSAKDTQGGLITLGSGNLDRGFGSVRYGGKLPSRGFYRFYSKYLSREDSATSSGGNAGDDRNTIRGGFRTEWSPSLQDVLSVQGDIYNGREGESVTGLVSLNPILKNTFNDRKSIAGGDVLGRWRHTFSNGSDTTLQLFYDAYNRTDSELGETRRTFDLDFQHHFVWGKRHDILWGFGYRFNTDGTRGSLAISFNPGSLSQNLYSTFAQDEIALLPGRLRLTLGAKFEHNLFTGLETQPGARLLWTPSARHAFWTAMARAVRTPARSDISMRVNMNATVDADGTVTLDSMVGNPNSRSEDLVAYEAGYRAQLARRLSFDLAAFHNVYTHLTTVEPGIPFAENSPFPPHVVMPMVLDNKMRGEAHGVETTTNWKLTDRWTLSAAYTLFQIHLHRNPSSQDLISGSRIEGTSPRHQFQFRSRLDLQQNLELDTSAYFVARLPTDSVPSYTRVDTRLRWRFSERTELSIVGQNLLQPRHKEFGLGMGMGATLNPSWVKRAAYAQLTWKF
jgi:iron complex outermembrane recepter protein